MSDPAFFDKLGAVFPIHFHDRSIARGEGLDERATLEAIEAGARVVVLDMVFALLTSHYVGRRRVLVRPGESVRRAAALPTLITALGGWWGLAAVYAPAALYRNLRGGVDVTEEVRAELTARLAQKAQRAAEERARDRAASDGPPEVRRVRCIELLDRGDFDGAWALVGSEVEGGSSPSLDENLERRLVLELRSRRLWGLAARASAILRRDHPDAVTGYLATATAEIDRHADRPDGYSPPTPLWAYAFFIGAGLLTLAFLVAAATGKLDRR